MFEVNDPNLFGAVNHAIDSYASPEAARQDFEWNAPRTNQGYIDRFRALTGDAFADPWAERETARNAALTFAASHGASVATGNLATGPTTLRHPIGVFGGGADPIPEPVAASDVASAIAGAAGKKIATLQHQPDPFNFALSKPSLQLPTPEIGQPAPIRPTTDMIGAVTGAAGNVLSGVVPHQTDESFNADFQDVQRRRANSAGSAAAQLYADIRSTSPDLLVPPVPNNQTLEFDAEGKPIAGNVLHHKLFNDPRFQRLLKTNPTQASNFYRAITDRDLTTDIKMQGGNTASVLKAKQSLIDEFNKNEGTFDPDTGEPVMNKLVEDKLRPGEYKTVKVPVGEAMRQALGEKGFFEARTGFKQPGPRDLSHLGPLDPSTQKELRRQMSLIRQGDPNLTDRQVELAARDRLFGRAKDESAVPWYQRPEQAAGIAGHAYNRVVTGIANKTIIDPINAALGRTAYRGQIPRIQPFTGSLTDTIGDLFYRGAGSLEGSGVDEQGYPIR